MSVLAFLLAGGVGLVLGALGGGGSILAVPIFVYGLNVEPKLAIAMSLPVIGLTSLVGAWSHWREGQLDVRRALLFGAVAMAGAYGGARLAVFLTGARQLTLLAIVMVAAAIAMLRSSPVDRPNATGRVWFAGTRATSFQPPASSRPEDLPPEPGAGSWKPEAVRRSPLLMATTGFAIGALTGLVGVGGGFLFVPALVLVAGVPMKHAVGTSLLVIAMSATAGLLGYVGRVAIAWSLVALFAAVASAGILLGVRLVRFIPQRALRRTFAVFLLLVAGVMLYHNLAPVRPAAALMWYDDREQVRRPPVAMHATGLRETHGTDAHPHSRHH